MIADRNTAPKVVWRAEICWQRQTVANIAILRSRALDLARRDTSKGSLSIKLKRADWSDALLLSLLQQLERVAFNRIHAVTRTRLQAQTLPRVAA